MDIPAYTFRFRNLFQAGNISKEIKEQITEDKFKRSIFHDLYSYLKSENLDEVFRKNKYYSKVKSYIN